MQPSDSAMVRDNFRHMVWDVVWFGLAFAATSRFLSVFAIREGANAETLSLMASLPAIVNMISASFAAFWRKPFPSALDAMFLPDLFFRFVFIFPALTPWLPPEWRTTWLVVGMTLPSLGQGVGGVLFIVSLNEAIPRERMVSLISARSLAFNVSLGVCVLAYGAWLQSASYPVNFQLMFGLAFVASLISKWHVGKIRPHGQPPPVHQHQDALPDASQMPEPPALRTNDDHAGPWKSPQFRTMLAAISIIHIVFFAVYAIIPLRLVRDLGANEGFIAIFGLLELVGGALVSLRGTYLIERFGHRRMLTIALSITALAVAIVASASSLPLTLLGALLSGAAWTMAGGVVTYGMYSALTPAENSTSYSTAFHQVLGLSVFLGPFIGSALANSGADLATVLWVGAVLRLAGCLAGGIVPSQHLRRAEGQAG